MACRRAFSIAGNGTGRNYEHAIASASAQGHRRSADHRGEGGLQLADRAERPLGSATVERACGGHRPRAIDGRPRGAGLLRRDRGGFGTLGFDKRPTDVADQQACAARRPRPADGPVRGRFRTVRAACRTDPHHRFRHDRPTAVPQRAPVRSTACSTWARCRSSTKTIPSRPTRSRLRRQRPSVRAHRQHRCRPTRFVLLTDVDALYTRARQAEPRLEGASPMCRTSRTRWRRFRSAEPARTSAPAAWSPKWRPRASPRCPAFPRC